MTDFIEIQAGGLHGAAGRADARAAESGYAWEIRATQLSSAVLARGRTGTFPQAHAALIAGMRALVDAQAAALGGTVDWHTNIQKGA